MMATKPIGLVVVAALLCAACREEVIPTSPSTGPTVETFASQLTPRGTASRTLVVRETGTVTVTLAPLTPAIEVGLGVGIPSADGRACLLSQSVETAGGGAPQITTTAEAGTYCVKIYDLGTLSGPLSFSITVQHP